MIQLIKGDNKEVLNNLIEQQYDANLIYADMIYENPDFDWVRQCRLLLNQNGVFAVQLDDKLVAEMKLFCDEVFGKKNFINWIIWWNEWGGVAKRKFSQKKDHILIYSKGKDYKWYPDRIQIAKATAGTKLDKKGTGLKTPMDVFYDISSFSTLDKERVKVDNHNIQWQKPLKLIERLLLPFTDAGDLVVDPFLGSGTTGVWCRNNKRNFIGIENDPEVFDLAVKRLNE